MSEPSLSFAIQTHRVQFVVPCELIKKNIKTIQKQLEKSKKLIAEELEKIKRTTLLSAAEKLASVNRLIKIYDQLHKKLAVAMERDQDYRLRLSYRAERLSELKNFTMGEREMPDKADERPNEPAHEVLDLHNENLISWYREETNILIIDYLLKSNVKKESNIGLELLKRLESRSGLRLSKLIDHDIYTSYNRVHRSICEDHDLEAISTWYNDNRTALKKVSSNLLFEIHYCKYLSLIESGDPFLATEYSKKNLAPYARRENYGSGEEAIFEKNRDKLTRLGSLLVFISSFSSANKSSRDSSQEKGSLIASLFSQLTISESSPFDHYNRLLTEEYWQELAECFSKDYTRVYGISQTYPLFVYLSAGLSSLKTKSCFCNKENTIFGANKEENYMGDLDSSSLRDLALRGPNQYYRLLQKINQCPVCSPELYALSENLPYAQLITSIYNNPFKLPNGNIYPFDKLLNPDGKFERDNLVRNGKVRDPLTHEIFFIDDCARVFPA